MALNDLTTALESNSTTDDIGDAVTQLRSAYDQLTSARTFFGSTVDQIVGTQVFSTAKAFSSPQQQNSTVGIDMDVAVTDLTNAEESRAATVQAASSMKGTTLDGLPGEHGSAIASRQSAKARQERLSLFERALLDVPQVPENQRGFSPCGK